MKIAKNPRWFIQGDRQQRFKPQRPIGAALAIGNFDVELRQVPIEQQVNFDEKGIHVVFRNPVIDTRLDRNHILQSFAVHFGEQTDRRFVASYIRCRRVAAHDHLVTKIFDDQQAGIAIGREDRRRRKAAAAQCVRHRDERRHAFRQMCDRAVRLAIAHGRSIGPLWRIHQDIGRAVAGEPLVAARRGVALDAAALSLAKT